MSFNVIMHPRNIYRESPNFELLAADYPALRTFLIHNNSGKVRIDFRNPNAVRTLTESLLKKDFDLSVRIPEGSLIPTVPQRLNYLLWIEDLLKQLPSAGPDIFGIDIGTGPCCVFALLGARKNGWNFLATDVDDNSVHLANENIKRNNLQNRIKVIKTDGNKILEEVCRVDESRIFDFCMCNPPFFSSTKDSQRRKKLLHVPKQQEVITEGGEVVFVKKILKESFELRDRIRIFSSMVGKKQSFVEIIKALKLKGIKYSCCEFSQGKTKRWGIAWFFIPFPNLELHQMCFNQKRKRKPDFNFSLPCVGDVEVFFKMTVISLKSFLRKLQISFKVLSETDSEASLWIISYKNSWVHTRKKRREIERCKRTNRSNIDIVSSTAVIGGLCWNVETAENILQEGNLKEIDNQNCMFGHQKTFTSDKIYCSQDNSGCYVADFLIKPISNSSTCNQTPILFCKLLLKLTEKNVNIQFIRAGSLNVDAIYQLFQVTKNTFIPRQS